MSRLKIASPTRADIVMEELYKDLERRIEASPPGLCPVDMARAFLELCHAQTCGKCVPCRIGLGQLRNFIEDVLDGNATMETLDIISIEKKTFEELVARLGQFVKRMDSINRQRSGRRMSEWMDN